MENFTPISAITGGVLIGAAVVMLMWLNGRVAGISGIAGGILARRKGDTAWRLAFIIGLVAAPLVYRLVSGDQPEVIIPVALPLLIAGGLLVGLGTQLGSGCTSGHGVCGMSRLSFRSLMATLTFMLSGILTIYVVRHLLAGSS